MNEQIPEGYIVNLVPNPQLLPAADSWTARFRITEMVLKYGLQKAAPIGRGFLEFSNQY